MTMYKGKGLSVLSALRENGYLSIPQLEEKLGIPQRTIGRILLTLKENGFIERVGSRKTGYWKVK